MKVLMVDNVDSFTFTLVDYLRQLGATVSVVRSDTLSVDDAIGHGGPILIGPGPGRPEDAGISVALAGACLAVGHPLLGVCLGHQAIGLAAGGRIARAAPMHGKTDSVRHDGSGLFAGLPSPMTVTRYHSLVLENDSPGPLVVNAHGADGTIQGLRHPGAPIHGVQFHPEAILTDHGLRLLGQFLEDAADRKRAA